MLQVAEMMLLHSDHANPVITGSSVHNQRIECLWRDVFRCVLTVFYQVFYYLEERGVLDPLSDTDLYCLHLVYTHKINEALNAFASGWNNHAVTTEHSMTPIQLLAVGTLLNTSAINLPDSLSSEDGNFSVPGTVEIPHTVTPLDPSDTEVVESMADTSPSIPSNYMHYIDTYQAVRQYVYNHV